MKLLRRWFLAGLLVWAPLGVTLLVIRFLVNLLDSSLILVPRVWQPDWFGIPGIGAILTLLIVLTTGALTANLIGKKMLAWAEHGLERVPLIGSVYGSMKKIAETMFSGQGNAFKKVVLVEYPRKGAWSVGFMTADPIPEVRQAVGGAEPLVAVFIPTTPNPTSGFLVMVPRADVRELEMSVPDGMQYLISLGVVAPGEVSGAFLADEPAPSRYNARPL
jgi:uncharacterized membrane protein